MSDEEEAGYDLVMPFLPVVSKGGPYDDDAFVAGYEMGQLNAVLESRSPQSTSVTIKTANAAQADLIAMRHRYRCETTVSDEWPEWTFAIFTRAEFPDA